MQPLCFSNVLWYDKLTQHACRYTENTEVAQRKQSEFSEVIFCSLRFWRLLIPETLPHIYRKFMTAVAADLYPHVRSKT